MKIDIKTKGLLYIVIGTIIMLVTLTPLALHFLAIAFAYILINAGLTLWKMPPLYILIQYGLDDLRKKFFHT